MLCMQLHSTVEGCKIAVKVSHAFAKCRMQSRTHVITLCQLSFLTTMTNFLRAVGLSCALRNFHKLLQADTVRLTDSRATKQEVVREMVYSTWAYPQSASLTLSLPCPCSSTCNTMFSGFRSQWTIRRRWRCRSAFMICCKNSTCLSASMIRWINCYGLNMSLYLTCQNIDWFLKNCKQVLVNLSTIRSDEPHTHHPCKISSKMLAAVTAWMRWEQGTINHLLHQVPFGKFKIDLERTCELRSIASRSENPRGTSPWYSCITP